jgi:hypothetical protein
MTPDKAHNVRQVQLPSGKMIEVVYFADQHKATAPAQLPAPKAPSEDDLHVCHECGSELVYPLDWAEAGPTHWEVLLRCPECEWTAAGVYEQKVVERFDAELDRGAEALLHDLQNLTHANMSEDIERFVKALHADHILPCDF